ncbi:MAG TPA: serine--tRNA ligase [Candidatus Pacearchaeota archaeon]|nr:serine--tRNA ligase [Candidatus Pacearchaeota archaeon]HOK93946.1 serine--tRNA ligase [Candidatus Pacearchaeota archaeon]HPO75017.1 serine--tRNA ligase [Candidatus Pacearchaeota archaeon]
MLDINLIRKKPDFVKNSCAKRNINIDVDKILLLDEEKRKYQKKIEDLRFEQNKLSKESPLPLKKLKAIKNETKTIEALLKEKEEELEKLLFSIPNLPLEDVPIGRDERDNVVLREVGVKPKFDFQPKDHLEIGEKLDLIDVKRAAKVSGTRFGYLKNEAVLIEFALVKLALEITMKEGFTPVVPPVMIKPQMMKGMGYIDTKEDLAERYFLEKDNLFLVGTSEQSIGPMHADEIFEEKELPRRYVGFSTCFREEAGSYGKDSRGILRVHQFDKVEMFIFCRPEDSRKEHQLLLSLEEKLMQLLKIPYRVVQLCTGDIGRSSAATFDVESWMPGQEKYRETHSCSNCTDFQSRRLNIKYKTRTSKLQYVHTLNGTAFAIGRTLIAILENYQQKDGSVKIPEVLQEYIGKKVITKN